MKKTRKSTGQRSLSRKTRKTSDALDILDAIVVGDDGLLRDEVKQSEIGLEVAQLIYDARTSAALSQAELARLVRTNQSVISRLEDANYNGHSLSMLRRIAEALGKRLTIRFQDKQSVAHSA